VSGGISLGGLSNGESAGEIRISSSSISPELFTPAVLNFTNEIETAQIATNKPGVYTPGLLMKIHPEIDVVRIVGSNTISQIKTPELLVDVRVLSAPAVGYELHFFPATEAGVKVAGRYTPPTEAAAVIWRFSSPTGDPSVKVIKIEKIVDNTTVSSVLFNQVTPGASIVERGDLREIEMTTSYLVGGIQFSDVETTTSNLSQIGNAAPGSVIYSHIIETYKQFEWGREKIKSVVDPGGANLITQWTYYDTPDPIDIVPVDPAASIQHQQKSGSYSHLKTLTNPDGSWAYYTYLSGYGSGKVHKVHRPWKDVSISPTDATASNSHVTTYFYNGGYSTLYFSTYQTSSTATIPGSNGGTITISSPQYSSSEYSSDLNNIPIAVRRTGTQESANYKSDLDVPQHLRGRPAYSVAADGRRTDYAYAKGNYVNGVFAEDAEGSYLRSYESEKTPDLMTVVGKSLRNSTISSLTGAVVHQERFVKSGAGEDDYASIGATRHFYDAMGRLERTTENGRITYEATWLNGRLATETDESGITTTFDIYDSEGRVTEETRLGIVTKRVYDPLGRMTSTSQSHPSSVLPLSASTIYDDAGRVKTETREDGLTVSTTYPSPRVTTRTFADTSTEISETYLDGQSKSVTGTAVVARYFDYGADSNGLWRKESVATLNSARYTQSWTDSEGRAWRSATSGPSGLIVTTNFYHSTIKSRIMKRTVPGEAPMLFGYDASTGEQIRQARDLNLNDQIDLGSDAVNETTSNYVLDDGKWFSQSLSYRYENDGSAVPTLLSTTRQQLTNLSPLVSSITQSIDAQNNLTQVTTTIDRATQTGTTTTDVPDSNLNAVEVTIGGRLKSTTTPTVSAPTVYNTYDGLGRLTTMTSPRGVVTSTVFDPATGRVSSVTHAGKETSYTYHPAGTVGAGRVATTTQPDTKVIRTSYTLRGEDYRVWGGATYPLERTYDAYGQLQFLKTYRGGSGWSGTTWPETTTGTADTTEWRYYQATGQLHQKLDAEQKATTYTYHDDGKMKSRQRARGPITNYRWNNLGQPESTIHSDATASVSTLYDRAGRPKTLSDAAGTHTYDYGVPLQVTETITGGILAGVTRTATRDTYERPSGLSVTSGTNTHSTAYQYNPISPRLEKITTGTESATYGYLTNSDAIQTLAFKLGTTTRLTTTRSYDTSDRLDGVTNAYGSSLLQTFGVSEFDAMNRRKKITREDATRWAFGYNDKGEVTSGIREKTSTSVPVPGWSHGYTFDEIGNRLTATNNGRISSYTPNALNQYENRTVPRAFDILGKASSASDVLLTFDWTLGYIGATRLDEYFYAEVDYPVSGAVHVPYSVSAFDGTGTTTRTGGKFLPATPEPYDYDDDGNLTSDGRFTYTWDAENRLVAMETLPAVPTIAKRKLSFAYDAMSRRIRKTTWHGTASGTWQLQQNIRFIHELGGWNILADITSDGKFLRTYTWGTDLSGNLSGAGGVGGLLFTKIHGDNSVHAHGMDLNGNVSLLVSTTTGQATATYDYGPFGEPLRQSGEYAILNPYRFSTKYTDDETGLLDYGYRYYDPVTGRWPSRDPIGEEGGINLYGFVGNDSISRTDFLGLKNKNTYFSYIFAGHGWHTEGNPGSVEKNMAAAIKEVDFDKKYDRVSAVSCFNGNINQRYERSIKSSGDQFDDVSITDYINYFVLQNPAKIWNRREPGFLWINEPIQRKLIADSFKHEDWSHTGKPEAYNLAEEKIRDVENQAEKDIEEFQNMPDRNAPCKLVVKVFCPASPRFTDSSIDFHRVTPPAGKSFPCGYVNTVKFKNGKATWEKSKFNNRN
jgi:RHS repeat-associated protein